jgi:hypothetical protein
MAMSEKDWKTLTNTFFCKKNIVLKLSENWKRVRAILPWILLGPNFSLGKSLHFIYIQEIKSCQEEIRKLH